jgi:tetratricopeptide (TPR) repeat protein
VVPRATTAALNLSPLSDCTSARLTAGAANFEEVARRAHPEIAKTIDRAAILSRSGEVTESAELAEEGRSKAHEASAPSLEATALAVLGRNKIALRDWPSAERLYFDAFEAAERSGAYLVGAESALKLGFVDAMLNKTDDAQRWLRLAAAAIDRSGGDQRLSIALAQIRASALFMAGDEAAAVQASRAALNLAEPAADKFPMLLSDALNAYGNAVSVTVDSTAKDAAYERALAIAEKELGPAHPNTGVVLDNLALARLDEGRYEEARGFAERAVSISERLGPGYALQASDCTALGRALTGLHRYTEARSYLERALTLAQGNPAFEKRELAYLEVALGQLDDRMNRDAEAERAYERATSLFDEALGKGRPEAAAASLGLGLLRLKEGRSAEAVKALETSLAESDHGDVAAWQTRLALAEALWKSGTDRDRARRLAEEAVDHFAAHPAGEDEVREIEHWLREHGALGGGTGMQVPRGE